MKKTLIIFLIALSMLITSCGSTTKDKEDKKSLGLYDQLLDIEENAYDRYASSPASTVWYDYSYDRYVSAEESYDSWDDYSYDWYVSEEESYDPWDDYSYDWYVSEEESYDVSIVPDQFEFDPYELTVWDGKVFHNASLLHGGSFEVNEMGELETTGEHNIGVVLNDTFTTGKISATFFAAGGAEGDNDNGIIFGLGEGEENYFWEREGRSYYFLFVSDACDLYLAKVGVNPAKPWQEINTASLADNGITYVHGMEITISAEVKADGTIICSADGKELITYKNESPLKGTGYGVRGEWAHVCWSDLTVEKY